MDVDLATAEEAAIRLRVNCILDSVGPKLFERHNNAVDLGALADGLRLEAALHAAISGTLAIRGVPPFETRDSVGAAFQDAANNTADGAYDILEGEYRQTLGMPGRFTIPTSPSAPAAVSEIPDFASAVGIKDPDLVRWWESDTAPSLQSETAQAGAAAQFYLTHERFGRAPPVQAHGRNGAAFLEAPDVVNTWEHLDAQLGVLGKALESQRNALRGAVTRVENIMLAAYEHLYQGSPAAAADLTLVRRHFETYGEIPGGRPHIQAWIADWMRSLGVRHD